MKPPRTGGKSGARAMAAKRYPLPKRFNAALSEAAYDRLRALNGRYGFSNNYLLTILLENLDRYADPEALDRAFRDFAAEYGAPPPPENKKQT